MYKIAQILSDINDDSMEWINYYKIRFNWNRVQQRRIFSKNRMVSFVKNPKFHILLQGKNKFFQSPKINGKGDFFS